MEQIFTSVDRSRLLKAFTLAHRCATDFDTPDRERKYFRAIAYEIWMAHGEVSALPDTLPTPLAALGESVSQEARRG
jgi:hypothetical protein